MTTANNTMTTNGMIGGAPSTTAALASTISAVSFQGLSVSTPHGEPASLAIVDQHGNVVEAGPDVARAVWGVAIAAYRNFLLGKGYMRVLSQPTELKA